MKERKNKKLGIAFIFGTRPETIKMYPVIREAKKYPELVKPIIVLSAQHREMMDQMVNLFEIEPDFDLNIMKHGQSLSELNSLLLLKLEEILQKSKPDLVLVQGDTTTTFSGALAAFYQKIKVGHIEAGLRTGKKYYPYPEEINRRLTTILADYHFAPTKNAVQDLYKEGIAKDKIFLSGNTVIDTLMLMQNKRFRFSDNRINKAISMGKKILLVTMHRRENWGQPLVNLSQALFNLSKKQTDLVIVFPLHKNPQIRGIVYKYLQEEDNIILTEPLDYQEMANMMSLSSLVLTDSGGIQEEAPALGKPVLILRSETERPEVVQIGAAKLVGTKTENIEKEIEKLFFSDAEYQKMVKNKSPYGDGQAAKRIMEYILYQYHLIDSIPSEYIFKST
jgi:UDP-N-acetylglucosamine 2-epimerase (non-hydrolysing)